MSHVDEGALHAYLDGALDEYPEAEASHVRDHLETCQHCAIRLEAQRRVRQGANAILGLAVPHVEVPSFEELRAYVKATRPMAARASVRVYRLGWAASVVLAIGAGWLVRDGQLADAPRVGDSLVAPTTPSAEGVDAIRAARPGADADAAAETEAVVAEERSSFARGTAPDDALAEGASRQESATVAAARDRLAATVATEPNADVAVGTAKAIGVATGTDSAPAPTAVDFRAVSDVVAANSAVGRDSAGRELPPQLEAIVVTGSAGGGAGRAGAVPPPAAPTEITVPLVEQTAARPDTNPSATSGADAGASRDEGARRRAEAEPVAARLEAGPTTTLDRRALLEPVEEADVEWLVVPGLQVLSYASLAEGTAPTGLHVTQALGDGSVLDVYHLPEGVEPSVLPDLEEGRNEAGGLRDGKWVVLRAALDPDSLGELLARMVPQR
jgi:hypothetical protein